MPDYADAGDSRPGGRAGARGSMTTAEARLHAGVPGSVEGLSALPAERVERAACLALFGFAAALQVSIAAADILLTIATLLWLVIVVRNRERIAVPPMFWPLAAYGAATLVSAAFSIDPHVSLVDSKQLVLLVIVPLVYRLLPGRRSLTAVDVVITVGAISAAFGIVQYLILN